MSQQTEELDDVRVVVHRSTVHLYERLGDTPTACGADTDSARIESWDREEVRDEMLDRGLHPCRRQGCFGTNEHLLEEAAS